ncbi:MAG: ATP-binding protein [Limisphaerales bacterium]
MVGLESIALFRNLKPGELQALRLITQERHFPAGSEIFSEGMPGDGVYFVKDGLVEISGFARSNVRHVFSQLGPGEIFGEMAVIEQLPRSASAVAVKDAQVYFVPRGEMLSLIERTPTLAFGLLQQISHRLREFNQLHMRELVQAESLAIIGRFAQSIVHDLKNPLSIIGLSAETYDMPNINPIMRAQIGSRIRNQINRIQVLISDILIFHEGRRSETEMRTTDYHAFIRELIPELRAETEAKGAKIEMPDSPPAVRVRLDARRLSRVFFNLLGNAMDFMPKGGKIFLRFRADENEIVTEIEDTGTGVAPEIAGKLFKDLVTFGKPHGTGLGLSICKKIVEDHGGRIWLRNEPGRGAIFCFALPLAK